MIICKWRRYTVCPLYLIFNYNRSQKEAEQEAQKARNAQMWLGLLSFIVVISLLIVYHLYRQHDAKKRSEIRRLSEDLASAKNEYRNVQAEMQMLKKKDYENLLIEKEHRVHELKEMIVYLSKGSYDSDTPNNDLEQFEKSKIVEVFRNKRNFKAGNPSPNKSEWRALELQFSKDMPSVYKMFTTEKKLSPLELHICILLLLDFDDTSIINLTNSIPQTISTSKARANKKLFGAKGAASLKFRLLQLIMNV